MPNFVHVKVAPERLSASADNIDNNLLSLERAINAVDVVLQETRPTWKGPASDLFYTQYSTDAQSFASLVSTLRSLSELLKRSAGIYDKADGDARGIVNGLNLG